ncbi:hypothetical protein [Streptomyces sp. NPDC007856]|uniref:hypothetical protein n=1 Tax=Streptomyces sp. NPDC007856 TaxID=3364781 RepID=UPI0036B573EF
MESFFKECGCALGKQREEARYDTQDDAIERLTQIQWRPRQRMTEYSTGWHVDSSINVRMIPPLGSRLLHGTGVTRR